MALLRNGLTYSMASNNSNAKARIAYDKAIKEGKSEAESKAIYGAVYNMEMNWYES